MKNRRKKAVGRPELPAGQKRRPRGIPFSDDEMDEIREAAAAAHLPISVFIREAVFHRIKGR